LFFGSDFSFCSFVDPTGKQDISVYPRPAKAEKFNVLSAVVAIFSTLLSLPTFIDVLTDEFHRRRRKVPGGAAGLQNQ
jgi:hypothetical protein